MKISTIRLLAGGFCALSVFAIGVIIGGKIAEKNSEKNSEKNLTDFEKKLIVAENGSAQDQTFIAKCYHTGTHGAKKSYEDAFIWYTKAAEKGDAEAQCGLGDYYNYGIAVAQSDEEATKWYTRAAEKDHIGAQFRLGHIHEVAQEYEEAVKWYTKAAEKDHIGAQFRLGHIHEVTQHYEEAAKWYTKATETEIINDHWWYRGHKIIDL